MSYIRAKQIPLKAVILGYWITSGMLAPILAPFALSIGATPFLVTIILAAQTLPSVILAVPIGGLADRFGYRPAVIVGGVISLGGLAFLPFIDEPLSLIPVQAMIGLGLMSMWISIQSWMITPPSWSEAGHSLDKQIASFSQLGIAGQLVGPALGGALASIAGYAFTFWVIALIVICCTLSGIFVEKGLVAYPQDRRRAIKVVRQSYPLSWKMLFQPGVLLTMLVSFCALFLMSLRDGIHPLFFAEQGINVATIGLILTTGGAFAVLSRAVIVPALKRFKSGTVVMLFLIPGVFATCGVFLFTDSIAYFVLAAAAGFALGAVQALSLSLTANFTSAAQRGLGIGLRMVANRAAQSISPIVFGLLLVVGDFPLAFTVSGLAIAMLVVFAGVRISKL